MEKTRQNRPLETCRLVFWSGNFETLDGHSEIADDEIFRAIAEAAAVKPTLIDFQGRRYVVQPLPPEQLQDALKVRRLRCLLGEDLLTHYGDQS